MGNEESTTRQQAYRIVDSYAYTPVAIDHRTAVPKSASKSIVMEQSGRLLKTAYHATWSMAYPEKLGPSTRIGQCFVYDEERRRIVIAYGADGNGECLNDVWVLDVDGMCWSCINKAATSPRQFPSATLLGNQMWVFGGVHNHNFFADLHSINIDDGSVNIIVNNGIGPGPRTSPVMFSTDEGNLYMWGGFNGSSKSGVHVLRDGADHWHRFEIAHTGRAAAAFCKHRGRYFVFGSSKGHGLLEFHPEVGEFETIDCTGTEPQHQLSRASLVSVDEYLFLIGGEADSQFMHIFALDVNRKWWFAFHVRPDMESISLADGNVNKNGLFMLPREYSASVCYDSKKKEIISVLGTRLMNPVPVFRLSIGAALSSLHMRSDMIEAFMSSSENHY